MKTSQRCPKCACTKLYVVDEVRQPAHDSINLIVPMHVTTAALPTDDLGLPDSNPHRSAIGRFEAWICSECGYTEWYAKDFAATFEKMLELGRRVHVRVVETTSDEPYR